MRSELIIKQTRNWVEHVVIKHNFCPFAHKPARQQLIRYQISHTDNKDDLVNDLVDELILLRDAEISQIETTILVAPNCFVDFLDYNHFLDIIDMLILQFNLQGVIQVASFHPHYQFADLDAEDVRNYTNRSPYPMFHLIREDSIEKARKSHTDVEIIPEKNMAFLMSLGLDTAKQQLAACYDTHTTDEMHEHPNGHDIL